MGKFPGVKSVATGMLGSGSGWVVAFVVVVEFQGRMERGEEKRGHKQRLQFPSRRISCWKAISTSCAASADEEEDEEEEEEEDEDSWTTASATASVTASMEGAGATSGAVSWDHGVRGGAGRRTATQNEPVRRQPSHKRKEKKREDRDQREDEKRSTKRAEKENREWNQRKKERV